MRVVTTPFNELRSSLIRSLIILLCLSAFTVAYAQEFAAEDPLRFSVLSPNGGSGKYSFVVRSTLGQITLKTLRVRGLKGPDGHSLPDDSVGVNKASDLVNEDGTLITLTPKPDIFVSPGEYRLDLLLEGRARKGTLVRRTLTVLLSRKAAEINLESLRDQTLEVTRDYPWSAAEGSYVLWVRETSGKSAIGDLAVDVEPVYTEKGRVLSSGKVIARAELKPKQGEAESKSAMATPEPKRDLTVPANTADDSQWAINVGLSSFDSAGAYISQLGINSTSFESAKSIQMKIVIRDHWLIPLLVIFLGVFGSYMVNRIAQDWQPRQRNKQKLVRLRIEADKLLRVIKKTDKAIKLQSIINNLRDAEITNEQGDWASAKAQLEEPAKALDELRARETVEQAAAFETMNGLVAAVESYRESNLDLTEEEQKVLAAIARSIAERRVEILLANAHTDEANEQLDAILKEFDKFKRGRLEKDLAGLKRRLLSPADVPPAHMSKWQHITELIQAAEKIIREGDTEAARAKLEEIATALDELESSMPSGLLDDAPLIARVLLMQAEDEGHAANLLRITLLEPTDVWTTGTPLHFVIADPNGVLRQGDRFRWYFGNAQPVTLDEGSAVYHFDAPGSYEVRVEVLRGEDEQVQHRLVRPVTIRPSEAEVALSDINRRFRRSEVVLTAVALMLATLSGLIFLYADKPFGSFPDYLLALFWGFGIDSSVRGFAGVLTTVSRQEGK